MWLTNVFSSEKYSCILPTCCKSTKDVFIVDTYVKEARPWSFFPFKKMKSNLYLGLWSIGGKFWKVKPQTVLETTDWARTAQNASQLREKTRVPWFCYWSSRRTGHTASGLYICWNKSVWYVLEVSAITRIKHEYCSGNWPQIDPACLRVY
jgi:hypothetical protein